MPTPTEELENEEVVATPGEASSIAAISADEGGKPFRTNTQLTFTLQSDGFVGLRQARAAADNAARQLRGVLPYDVQTVSVSTTFDDGRGQKFTDLGSASELPSIPVDPNFVPIPPGPVSEPVPTRIAPLNVEEFRGGLPEANLSIDTPTRPDDALTAVATTAPVETQPSAADPNVAGTGSVPGDASESPDDPETPEELAEMTKAELMELAVEREIEGRSAMTKAELVQALIDEGKTSETGVA